jgi:hypothetical protein
MTPQDPGGSDNRPADPAPTNCTLKPIAEDGPNALPPDTGQGIVEVKLHKLQLGWDNESHSVTTIEADDIFHSTDPQVASLLPLPAGAALRQATLDFRLSDTAHLSAADIRPPNQIRVARPKHARRIVAWLSKHRFLLSPLTALSHLLAVLALALAAGTALIPDDDPDDPDDDDHHHHASRLP